MHERWSILYQDAVERWLDTSPSGRDVERLLDWLDGCHESGPPESGVLVFSEDDLYAVRVPRSGIVVTYLVVAFERLIILKDID